MSDSTPKAWIPDPVHARRVNLVPASPRGATSMRWAQWLLAIQTCSRFTTHDDDQPLPELRISEILFPVT
jgi:hypothetical protein